MQKLLTYFLLTLIILACKKEVKPDVIDDTSTQFVSFPNRPEIQNLNPEAQAVLSKWPEFQEFQNSFEVMYRAQNNEDLVLAIDDLLVKEKAITNNKNIRKPLKTISQTNEKRRPCLVQPKKQYEKNAA